MMKFFVFGIAMFAASRLFAAGPLYEQKDPVAQQEFVNVYHDIKDPVIDNGKAKNFTITTATFSYVNVSTETVIVSTISSATIRTKLTVPNGSAATDAAAYGQLVAFGAPVQATYTGAFSTSNSAYQATGFTVTITPTSASHRVLLFASFMMQSSSTGASIATWYTGGSDILSGSTLGMARYTATSTEVPVGYTYIHSPATTSATTYEIRLKSGAGTAQIGDATIALIAQEVL